MDLSAYNCLIGLLQGLFCALSQILCVQQGLVLMKRVALIDGRFFNFVVTPNGDLFRTQVAA